MDKVFAFMGYVLGTLFLALLILLTLNGCKEIMRELLFR